MTLAWELNGMGRTLLYHLHVLILRGADVAVSPVDVLALSSVQLNQLLWEGGRKRGNSADSRFREGRLRQEWII